MLRSKTYTTMHVLLYDLVNKLSYLLNIRWWLLRYRYHKYAKTFGCWASGARRTAWESAFELILTAKMETRHPIWSWLSAFAITAELRWPAGLKSQDYVPKIYVATPIDVVVLKCRKICSTRYWQNCALFTGQKKNKILDPSQTFTTAWIAPKICQDQTPTFDSHYSRWHPNRFTFGGSIADHVKAVLLAHRVNPWFARMLSGE